jgi:predicted lipoprotein
MRIKIIGIGIVVFSISLSGCNKATPTNGGVDLPTLEQNVIDDFVNNTVTVQYQNLVNDGTDLNNSLAILNTNTTDANLQVAQASWKKLRRTWEQCEGFLFGPVEDNDYDPNTDTWPTDYTQMDSLLASNNPLQPNDIKNLKQSLRGYHPIEYIIFGVGGSRSAASLTAREKLYMTALSADALNNNIQPLYDSWFQLPDNYSDQIILAGKGSKQFASRQELFLVMASALSDICEEVGGGKMYEPFVARDSTICESPYSGNTLSDFKDNIVGVRNVYMGLNTGLGIKDLVSVRNKNLDNQIQSQMESAINSFDNITVRFERAIFEQRQQVQLTMNQLESLKDLLENELKTFIQTNIKD